MYCKHCGKVIADDSKFCQHCGGEQTKESVKSSQLNSFIVKHKKLSYAYLIWLAINISVLTYATSHPHKYHSGLSIGIDDDDYIINTSAFYPFESFDIGTYDFAEFVFYTVAVPLFIFAVVKLVLMTNSKKQQN